MEEDDLPDEADFDVPSDDDEPVFDLGEDEDEEEDDFGNKRPSEIALPPAKKPRIDSSVFGAPANVRLVDSRKPESQQPQNMKTLPLEVGAAPILTEVAQSPEEPPENLLEEEIPQPPRAPPRESLPPREALPPREPQPPREPLPPRKSTQLPETGRKPVSRQLYTLMIRQLQDDGFADIASSLSNQCDVSADSSLPINALSDKLSGHEFFGVAHSSVDIDLSMNNTGEQGDQRRDGDNESVQRLGSYEARFVTSHKRPVRCTTFSRDGKLAATGGAGATIKLLDVGKMHYSVLLKHTKKSDKADHGITRPVIRSYHDHEDKVNDLDFHPGGEYLLSGGADGLILYWNIHKNVKRSQECLQEHGAVRSLHCHPSGDYFLSGGDYPMIRLYDTETMQGYVAKDMTQHTGSVTCVRWAPEGNIFATSSKDGTIRIWDGVNMTCFNTIKEAHTGCEVSHLQFSKNSQFLLSNGKDSLVKLWDMSTGKCILNYVGAHVKGMRVNSCFSYNDEHVLTCSPRTNSIYIFDTKTGNIVTKIRDTHRSPVKCVSSSPCEAAILMGSNDGRAKFYAVQDQDS